MRVPGAWKPNLTLNLWDLVIVSKSVISEHKLRIKFNSNWCKFALGWITRYTAYDKSKLMQAMDWCHQEANHYWVNVYPCGTSRSRIQGVVSLRFRELSQDILSNLCITEIVLLMRISSWNFVREPKAMLLGTRTKFQLKILPINVISGIVYFREIILESSRNLSETTLRSPTRLGRVSDPGKLTFINSMNIMDNIDVYMIIFSNSKCRSKHTQNKKGIPGLGKKF